MSEARTPLADFFSILLERTPPRAVPLPWCRPDYLVVRLSALFRWQTRYLLFLGSVDRRCLRGETRRLRSGRRTQSPADGYGIPCRLSPWWWTASVL